jgi:hypothetical protein
MAPNGGGMRVEKQIFPNGFDAYWVLTQQSGRQMIVQQSQHRAAACANGVGIARGLNAIAAMQSEQNSFLRHKGLDGVGPHHLGWQIDLTQFNAIDGDSGHAEENICRVRVYAYQNWLDPHSGSM